MNTAPPATMTSFLDHGEVKPTIVCYIEEAERVMADLKNSGVSITEITAKLLSDGVKSFTDSFNALIANVEEKKTHLLSKAVR